MWDPVSQVAYWYSGDQWVAGEDVESVRAKVYTHRHASLRIISVSGFALSYSKPNFLKN